MKKYLAEFIGTFAIVFFGTGAAVVNDLNNKIITHFGVAMAFGLIVSVVIYSFSEISGAHFNPAFTIGLLQKSGLSPKQKVLYLFWQIAGAIFASWVLHTLFPTHDKLGGTFPAGSVQQSFILEIILTFFLMLIALQTTSSQKLRPFAGLLIGATVALEALFAGPVCGASMNPARSLGPALVSGHLEFIWIYLTAPIIGGLLGNFAHDYLAKAEDLTI